METKDIIYEINRGIGLYCDAKMNKEQQGQLSLGCQQEVFSIPYNGRWSIRLAMGKHKTQDTKG